jgi:membrane-associated protease RseP (regulator of RpoE activity)
MTTKRTWRRAGLLIALSVVTAAATVFAASGKLDEPAQSFTNLLNPGHEGWLGIIIKDTDEAKAKELKLPHVTGVLVVSVIAGSSAEKAGFKPNDVILEFAGQRVRSVAQLRRLIEETPPDRTVSIQITRQGKLQTLEAKIEPLPNAFLETPDNPKYKIWIGPEFEVPQSPEPGQSLAPGPELKIIPLPPDNPDFRAWKGPGSELPQTPEQGPYLEPAPKWKIIPLPEVMPKFKIGPIPNPEAPGLPHKKPFVEPWPKGEIIPLPEVMPK